MRRGSSVLECSKNSLCPGVNLIMWSTEITMNWKCLAWVYFPRLLPLLLKGFMVLISVVKWNYCKSTELHHSISIKLWFYNGKLQEMIKSHLRWPHHKIWHRHSANAVQLQLPSPPASGSWLGWQCSNIWKTKMCPFLPYRGEDSMRVFIKSLEAKLDRYHCLSRLFRFRFLPACCLAHLHHRTVCVYAFHLHYLNGHPDDHGKLSSLARNINWTRFLAGLSVPSKSPRVLQNFLLQLSTYTKYYLLKWRYCWDNTDTFLSQQKTCIT